MPTITTPIVRDLVLVGGGHSHVQVLKYFAMKPEPGVRVTLVTQDRLTPYSGMLPGCIAGCYSVQDIHINLDRLCQFADARLIHAEVQGLDLSGQLLQLPDRPPIHYDVVSINTGAVPQRVHPDAITVKPIGQFLPHWQRLSAEVRDGDKIVVVGAGAGGVELIMAARASLGLKVDLTIAGRGLLPGHGESVRAAVLKSFAVCQYTGWNRIWPSMRTAALH